MSSPVTERKDKLEPKFLYGLLLIGEYCPSKKETTGLLMISFKYLILCRLMADKDSAISISVFLSFCRLRTKVFTPLQVYPSSLIHDISPMGSKHFKSRLPSTVTAWGDATSLSVNS